MLYSSSYSSLPRPIILCLDCVRNALRRYCVLVVIVAEREREREREKESGGSGRVREAVNTGQVFIQRRCLHLDKHRGNASISE